MLRISPEGGTARAWPSPPFPGHCCALCTVTTSRRRAHHFLHQRETSGLRTWFPKPLLASKPCFETSGWKWDGLHVAASLEAPRVGGTRNGLFRTTPLLLSSRQYSRSQQPGCPLTASACSEIQDHDGASGGDHRGLSWEGPLGPSSGDSRHRWGADRKGHRGMGPLHSHTAGPWKSQITRGLRDGPQSGQWF